MGNSWRRHARPGPFLGELRELQAVEVYNKLQVSAWGTPVDTHGTHV